MSSVNRTVAVMANSRSSDLTASKIMDSLKAVSGNDFQVFGYGGENMAKHGLNNPAVNVDQFLDKTFYMFRRNKVITEGHFTRWSGMNFYNKHQMRNVDAIQELLDDDNFPKQLYEARPSVILSIDNEYMTFQMMEKLNVVYHRSMVQRPQRHYYNRFMKDMRKWDEKRLDFMHYSTPLATGNSTNYRFPGQFCGQYGVYDALKHVMENYKPMSHLVQQDHVLLSQKYFAMDTEKAITSRREAFREENGISEDSHVVFVSAGNDS